LDLFFNVITFMLVKFVVSRFITCVEACLFQALYWTNFHSYFMSLSSRCFEQHSLSQWPPSWQCCKLVIELWEKLSLWMRFFAWFQVLQMSEKYFSITFPLLQSNWAISSYSNFASKLVKLGGTSWKWDQLHQSVIFWWKTFNTTLTRFLLGML